MSSVTKNKTDARYTENLFRPIYEVQTAAVWAAGAIATPFVGFYNFQPGWPTTFTIAGTMAAASVYFLSTSIPMLKQQMKLKLNKKEFMDVTNLRVENSVTKRASKESWSDDRRVFMGYGFEWGSEHANRAYQVLNMDSQLSDIKVPFPFNLVSDKSAKETEELGGKPFIHALGTESKITAVEDTFYAHTLITGAIGSGKTTLSRLLSLNALHLGAGEQSRVLVIIDPKNDIAWKESVRQEMQYLGMEERFYTLHPAKQTSSARIPLLKNYVRVTEIADRIAPLMGTSGGSKTFEDFAYEQLAFIAQGMEYIGDPIRLTTIRKALNTGKVEFCERVLRVFFERTVGSDYEDKIQLKSAISKGDVEPVIYLAQYYKANMRSEHENQAIEGILQFLEHPPEHFIKMITSLRPVLTALTTKPMDDLFSAIFDPESEDKRPIVDLEDIMEKGGCLYISLDSMTDNKTAGFLARLLMAEIAAVSGRRYNNEDVDAPRVAVFLDEAHTALENNDSLLNLLAVGRASSIELYLATQTIADLEAKTDEATAKRVLGLCNNFISFRTTDPTTQEYVAAQFSKTSVTQIQVQSQSGASSKESLFSFSATHGERAQKTFEDSFPPQLMGDLPKLQYIARMADGRKLKMRLPIIINRKPGERAPWLK